ncbi:MAG: hypothetical protein M5U09_28810 [Gammaproteobacteria bacterium]|nr:hypothetical protein [Gammaproteobacteria bacterium]
MNPNQIDRAAAAVVDGWLRDAHFEALPDGAAPADLDDGYAVQARFVERLGTLQAGWKLACTNVAGQRHVNVGHPLVGRLFADRVYPSPATIALRANGMRVRRGGVLLSHRARPCTRRCAARTRRDHGGRGRAVPGRRTARFALRRLCPRRGRRAGRRQRLRARVRARRRGHRALARHRLRPLSRGGVQERRTRRRGGPAATCSATRATPWRGSSTSAGGAACR